MNTLPSQPGPINQNSNFVNSDLERIAKGMPQNAVAFAADIDRNGIPDLVIAKLRDADPEGLQQTAEFEIAWGSEADKGKVSLSAPEYYNPGDLQPMETGVMVLDMDMNGDGLTETISVRHAPEHIESAQYQNMSPDEKFAAEGGYLDIDPTAGHVTVPAEARIQVISSPGFDPGLETRVDFNHDGLLDYMLQDPNGIQDPHYDIETMNIEQLTDKYATHEIIPVIVK